MSHSVVIRKNFYIINNDFDRYFKIVLLHKGAGAVPAGHMAEICSTEEEPVKLKIYIEKLNGRFVGVYKTLAII